MQRSGQAELQQRTRVAYWRMSLLSELNMRLLAM